MYRSPVYRIKVAEPNMNTCLLVRFSKVLEAKIEIVFVFITKLAHRSARKGRPTHTISQGRNSVRDVCDHNF